MTTFVLVHGAWHGSWCWRDLTPLLESDGHVVHAVDLRGRGDGRPDDLHGDAARVTEVLDTVDGPVVLLGHSYGGSVITEAGDHPAVGHLVFLCAFALDEQGSSVRALSDEEAIGISHDGRPDLADVVDVRGPMLHLHLEAAAPIFYGQCTPEQIAYASERLCPQPIACMTQVPSAVAWRTRASTYIVCTEDLAIHPGVQTVLAGRCTHHVVMESDHSPFFSHASELAAVLGAISVS